ncbi:MAG TPA: sigma 54-interacting transcriptional regulator, partial [Polyangiaceae bacterium]|nr:sigma 54-interacting transcriptional regulator [Polyangiaceae bacterium]
GESGTGKEVVSRELHALSGRRGDFHAVNCAAIPGQLLESELFGYKRGAFSGADRDKPGLIKLADQGTLLLDEIGDMPLEAQAKLLRVLQNKEVFPLGGTAAEHVDVRIVCATHRDLWRLQEAGKFREDLFARLNEYQLRLPPLRERKEDIYMLTRAFLTRHGRPEVRTTFAFMLALLHYDWPYNVRELEACIKRCLALTDRATLERDLIPDAVRDAMTDYAQPKTEARGSVTPATPDPELAAHSAMPTEDELKALLLRHQGNVAAVGRELGKARMQIHRWMKRYGIQIEDYRS